MPLWRERGRSCRRRDRAPSGAAMATASTRSRTSLDGTRRWSRGTSGAAVARRPCRAQVVIDKDKKDAAVVKEKVLVQEASATEISERAGAIAADAQADLDKALPALAAAVQCLKELEKAHIDEVKGPQKATRGCPTDAGGRLRLLRGASRGVRNPDL